MYDAREGPRILLSKLPERAFFCNGCFRFRAFLIIKLLDADFTYSTYKNVQRCASRQELRGGAILRGSGLLASSCTVTLALILAGRIHMRAMHATSPILSDRTSILFLKLPMLVISYLNYFQLTHYPSFSFLILILRRGKLNLQFIVTDFSTLHAGRRSLFRFQTSKRV